MTVYSNLRRNPFTSALSWRVMDTESHTVVELFELPGIYGFQLQDRPEQGSVTVKYLQGGVTVTEVMADPLPGQCRIDYIAGYVFFNIADKNKNVVVDYRGGGTTVSIENIQGIIRGVMGPHEASLVQRITALEAAVAALLNTKSG